MYSAACTVQIRYRGVIALMLCALLALQLLNFSASMGNQERMPVNPMPMLDLSMHHSDHGVSAHGAAPQMACKPEPSKACMDSVQAGADTGCCTDDTSVDCSFDHCMQLHAFATNDIVSVLNLPDIPPFTLVVGSPSAPAYPLYQPPISRFAA